jgi:hypothetical protein
LDKYLNSLSLRLAQYRSRQQSSKTSSSNPERPFGFLFRPRDSVNMHVCTYVVYIRYAGYVRCAMHLRI